MLARTDTDKKRAVPREAPGGKARPVQALRIDALPGARLADVDSVAVDADSQPAVRRRGDKGDRRRKPCDLDRCRLRAMLIDPEQHGPGAAQHSARRRSEIV